MSFGKPKTEDDHGNSIYDERVLMYYGDVDPDEPSVMMGNDVIKPLLGIYGRRVSSTTLAGVIILADKPRGTQSKVNRAEWDRALIPWHRVHELRANPQDHELYSGITQK